MLMNWKSTRKLRTALKLDLSQGITLLIYAIWGVLENETNVTSHLHIG